MPAWSKRIIEAIQDLFRTRRRDHADPVRAGHGDEGSSTQHIVHGALRPCAVAAD